MNPDPQAELLNQQGLRLQELDRHVEALEAYSQALRIRPDFIEAMNNRASAYKAIGQLENAVHEYERLIQLRPEIAIVHYNLGNALSTMGQLDAAIVAYVEAIRLKPDFVESHNNLGDAFQTLGKYAEAIHSYQRTLELQPRFATAYNNLAHALSKLGKFSAAISTYQRALVVMPDQPEIYNNLGSVLRDSGDLSEAMQAYQRAISLRPNYAEAHFNFGNLWLLGGHIDSAIQAFQTTLRLQPSFTTAASALVHQLQNICDWDGQKEVNALLSKVMDIDDNREIASDVATLISPLTMIGLSSETTAEQQLWCARRWAGYHFRNIAPVTNFQNRIRASSTEPEDRKLRIGYLSADFRTHPVAYLTVELFEQHSRDEFEVFGYSIGEDDQSSIHQRLVSAFDHFRELKSLSYRDAALAIANDQIDILVDLQGYTHHCRTEILAHRPAPIQVNYLGFPGTMGADFIDYILVDDYVVPRSQQPFFTERLVYLPGCFMVNDSQREISIGTPKRSDVGLPEKAFVFCAFNASYKITEAIFELWLRLLNVAPHSVLWLKDWNDLAVKNILRRANERGISADRLIFAPNVSMPDHLARHRVADLYLDTFPYNQHSTASDALRVGLPLITLSGDTFASRVAGSLLRELGMNELITHSYDAYEALVNQLATNPSRLNHIRGRLTEALKQTELYSGKAFAKKIEAAFHEMWKLRQLT